MIDDTGGTTVFTAASSALVEAVDSAEANCPLSLLGLVVCPAPSSS